MNKLPKSSIRTGYPQIVKNETTFEGYTFSYPIKGIKKCSYEAKVQKIGDYNHAEFNIRCTLTLEDSRDAVSFDKKLNISEDVDLLDEEDDAGEGFIVAGPDLDFDQLALRIIAASLPIKIVRDNSALPESGKGYRLLSEDEKAAEEENKQKIDIKNEIK